MERCRFKVSSIETLGVICGKKNAAISLAVCERNQEKEMIEDMLGLSKDAKVDEVKEKVRTDSINEVNPKNEEDDYDDDTFASGEISPEEEEEEDRDKGGFEEIWKRERAVAQELASESRKELQNG